MFLQQISEEYTKLNTIMYELGGSFSKVFEIYCMENAEFTISKLYSYADVFRNLSRVEGILSRERFISVSLRECVADFVNDTRNLYFDYDRVMSMLVGADEKRDKEGANIALLDRISVLKKHAWMVYMWHIKIDLADDILSRVARETWEPLPSDLEVECEDIIIFSETVSTSLSDVSKDIESLDGFLNNIYSLVNKDKQNSYFLRKVETGSLSVVISCITTAAPIISFIFFVIKLCQNTEKRDLNNKAKRLELIDKKLDIAKKILEIDPQNTEVNEVIQKSMLYLLQYFENNPKGTINGEKYDIGSEVLKIEEKNDE